MSPAAKRALETVALYTLFLLVYAIIAGLIGTFVGIVTGSTPDDVVRGLWIGVAVGLVIGLVVALIGRFVKYPEHGATAEAESPRGAESSDDGSSRP